MAVKITHEAFTLASAVLRCAHKTSIPNAFNELEMLFYSPQELQKVRHNRDRFYRHLEHLPVQSIQEN